MKDKTKIPLFQTLIFIFMFIFFTKISPLVPFDADDWLFNGTMRGPYPLWGAFNPTRVLPEILDPLGGEIAAFCIYPFTKDYIGSITIIQSLIVSLFVVTMFYNFFLLLIKKFRYSINVALTSEAMFFLSFFLLFKHLNVPSYTAFWTVDIVCTFFYLIPGLLNATLVIDMLKYRDFGEEFNEFNNPKKGIFLLLLYFALFSNSQFNIILATCVFCLLVKSLYKNKNNILSLNYFKKIWIYVLVLFTWLLTVIFDLNGGRAGSLNGTSDEPLLKKVPVLLNQFKGLLGSFNRIFSFFILLTVGIALGGAIYSLFRKNENKVDRLFSDLIFIDAISLILSLLYLLLAYVKAIPRYSSRPDAMWPVIFYFLFMFGLAVAFLISKFNVLKILSPLVIIMSCIITFNFSCPPIPSISGLTPNMTASTAKKIDYYIINQIIKADKAGKSRVTVKVSQGSLTDNNWPQAYYMAGALSQSLYAHHIINHRIAVEFKPSLKVNQQLNPDIKEVPFNPLEK